VSLWEADAELGGALALAAHTDETLAAFLRWQLRQLDARGVEVSVSTAATTETIASAGVDEVVVATGARWTGAPGAATPLELRAWLSADDDRVGRRVTILGGGKVGLSLAGLCARRGRAVTVVEPSGVFGVELGLPGRFRLVHELEQQGVLLVTEDPADADTVVATARVPRDELAASLTAAGLTVSTAGDCAGVRSLEGAMLDASLVAMALD
jgi:2,4-dienoyl-CoA reductase (NADPH2)